MYYSSFVQRSDEGGGGGQATGGLPLSKQALELFRAASTTLAQTFAREKGLFCILPERAVGLL